MIRGGGRARRRGFWSLEGHRSLTPRGGMRGMGGVTRIQRKRSQMEFGRGKARELIDEFRDVVVRRGGIVDAMLPPLAFLAAQTVAGPLAGMIAALAITSSVAVLRFLRRRSAWYALFGLGGSLLGLLLSQVLHRAEVFFLPDMITSLALAGASLVSVAFGRPLVAWTSHLVRRWPRAWYWHPRVRPAYTEVTVAWVVYFLAQALIQWMMLQLQDAARLAALGMFTGWPASVTLLALSYLYGTWRLARLGGPSVAEFRARMPPPWTAQRRGF